MTHRLRHLLLLSCLALPAIGHAATYKCTVDGRIAYQQQACSGSGGIIGAAPAPEAKPLPLATPLPRAPGAAGPSVAVAAPLEAIPIKPPTGPLDAKGREAYGREAVRLLKNDVARFKTLLCPNSSYFLPEHSGSLEKSAKAYANQGMEIGAMVKDERTGVSFATTLLSTTGPGTSRVRSDWLFSVSIDQDRDGRTCVGGFGSSY